MAALSKRVRTPPASGPAVEHQTGDPEHVLKRTRASGPSDEVCVSLNTNLNWIIFCNTKFFEMKKSTTCQTMNILDLVIGSCKRVTRWLQRSKLKLVFI